MFVLRKEDRVWWPVKVKWPDDKKAGRELTYEFDIELRMLDREELEARQEARNAIIEQASRAMAEIAQGDGAAAANASETLSRKLADHADQTFIDTITNWRGVVDEDKQEVEYSEAMLLRALGQARVRAGIEQAINDAIFGGGARVKN